MLSWRDGLRDCACRGGWRVAILSSLAGCAGGVWRLPTPLAASGMSGLRSV
jgi:hypothetical protein